MPTSPINPADPHKMVASHDPKPSDIPLNARKVDRFMKKRNQFAQPPIPPTSPNKLSVSVPQNTFLELADLLEINHSEKMMGFLKDYTDKEFIDEINAFKHLPIIGIALKNITQTFKKWDATIDRSTLEETLTNQFKNLGLLIDILTDLLPEAGERIIQIHDTLGLHPYLAGEALIGEEKAFQIRDQFRSQIHQKSSPL